MRITTLPRPSAADTDPDSFYPSSDGRPVGETPIHFRNSLQLFDMLEWRFAAEPQVYVAGNMFVYYVPGDRLKHVSPDLFVVFGVPKNKRRKSYRIWEEGKSPDLVVELTSVSTQEEDIDDKKWIYRDLLKVREYILFDPQAEYLDPALQGFRLQGSEYVEMPMVSGRLPSDVLGLHFEASGEDLRLFDPATGRWLLTPQEVREQAADTATELDRTTARLNQTATKLDQLTAERDQAIADRQRLEAEMAELRRRIGPSLS